MRNFLKASLADFESAEVDRNILQHNLMHTKARAFSQDPAAHASPLRLLRDGMAYIVRMGLTVQSGCKCFGPAPCGAHD